MARDLSTLGDKFKPGMRGLDYSCTFVGHKGKTCGIPCATALLEMELETLLMSIIIVTVRRSLLYNICLLYTSDAADE